MKPVDETCERICNPFGRMLNPAEMLGMKAEWANHASYSWHRVVLGDFLEVAVIT
jgi:hypothetical protein